MMTEKQPNPLDFEAFKQEFAKLPEKPKVTIRLFQIHAWVLLSQLQLALRHPKNTGKSSKIARDIAHQLQSLIATTPALAAIAEAGYHPELDHTIEPPLPLTDRQLDMIERAARATIPTNDRSAMILSAVLSLIAEVRKLRYSARGNAQAGLPFDR